MDMLIYLFQLFLALALAPLVPGIINRVKAKFAGRHGKPILQLYYDIAKLIRKGEVISDTATWVFTAGPIISMVTAVLALALLPLGGVASPFGFNGDFILCAYLLGMGRFATVLAALDTGSPFEGMGASREALFGAIGEPVLFLGFLFALCLVYTVFRVLTIFVIVELFLLCDTFVNTVFFGLLVRALFVDVFFRFFDLFGRVFGSTLAYLFLFFVAQLFKVSEKFLDFRHFRVLLFIYFFGDFFCLVFIFRFDCVRPVLGEDYIISFHFYIPLYKYIKIRLFSCTKNGKIF